MSQNVRTQNSFLPLILFLTLVTGLIYVWGALNFSSLYVLAGFLAVIFFFISFFHIRTGLGLLAIGMLFSPEFMIGNFGLRAVTVRLEDALLPVLLLAWLARVSLRQERQLLTDSPLNLPIFLLLALSVVSTIRGAAEGTVSLLPATFYIAKTAEYFAIFFLVLNYVRAEKSIKLFIIFSLVVVGLVGLYTFIQVPSVEIFTTRRITAPFEGSPEPATVGGYMAFLLLIIFSIFLYEKRPGMKWIYAMMGVVVFVPFLYTLNRTSYIALLVGMVFIAVVTRKKWVILLLFALLVASPFLAPEAVKERIAFTWEDAVNPGRDMSVDYSFQERIYAFRKMWNLAKDSIWIGWGISSWEIVDSQYARTLHEIGIIGLCLWLWIFSRLFRISRWLFSRLEDGLFKGMVLGYRAGLVGLLLHGFGTITFYIVRIMEPFWFISGLVVSLYLLKVGEEQAVLLASR